jgi:glutamine synthetase
VQCIETRRNNFKVSPTMGFTTLEELEAELADDIKVKVAGIDADGVMRGKIMAKDKFMSAARSGFGFCRSLCQSAYADCSV